MGVTVLAYGIGATGSMAVSKTVDVGSSPTCCAQPTHRLWERSPESLRRLLLLDAWQSGLLHHLAKVATGNGPGVRLPQHPRAVAGGKKPFLPLDFLMAVWVRCRAIPMFCGECWRGDCLFFCFGGGMVDAAHSKCVVL